MSNGIASCFRRVEKKYLLTPQQYHHICGGMSAHMEADRYSRYTICNLYYDTENDALIRASIEKPVFKEKLRLRSYGTVRDHDPVFVELKRKYDGVVYKRRVTMEAEAAQRYLNQGLCPEATTQIHREIDWFMRFYRPQPKVFLAYEREAYVGITQPELRITFDTGLRWRRDRLDLRQGQDGHSLLPPDQILMEVKLPDAAPLWLSRLLSEAGTYPTSFSKYGLYYKQQCLGHSPLSTSRSEGTSCA